MNQWTQTPRPRTEMALLLVLGLALAVLLLQLGCQSRPKSDPRDPDVFRPTKPVFPTP